MPGAIAEEVQQERKQHVNWITQTITEDAYSYFSEGF